MAYKLLDFAQVYSQSEGLGDFVLGSPVDNFKPIHQPGRLDVDIDTFSYTIKNLTVPSQKETGLAKLSGDGTILVRLSVFTSSNNNAKVNFSAGVKVIFVSPDATTLGEAMFGQIDISRIPALPYIPIEDLDALPYIPIGDLNNLPYLTGPIDFSDLTGTATSAQLPTILVNKTLTTPTILDQTNMQHNHLNAAGGGLLDAAAVGMGTFASARLPIVPTSKGGFGVDVSGWGGANFVVKQAVGGALSSAALIEADIPFINASKINAGDLAALRMAAAWAAGGYPFKMTTLETTGNAGFGIVPSVANDRLLIKGAAGINYFDNFIRVTTSANAQIFRISGDGRVNIGAESGQNVPFQINLTTGLPSGAVAHMALINGATVLLMNTGSIVTGGANFAFGANTFGNVIELVAPVSNGMIRVNGRNTTIGQAGLGGSPDKTLKVWDSLATTGVTTFVIKAGAGQGSTNPFEYQPAGSTTPLALIDSAGVGRFAGLRVDVVATASVVPQSHYINVNVNGTTYKLLLAA